jgi:penicillin-binding protein 2
MVTDRNGKVIIDSRSSYTVSILPANEVKGVTVPKLAELLKLDTTEVRNRMRRSLVNRYQPAPIARDIDFEVVAVLEEQRANFPGIVYETERVRRYADSLGGESFTGYVGEVSEEELKRASFSDLRPGSTVGKKGVERSYDTLLRGIEGTAYIEVSATGLVMGQYEGRKPIPAVAGTDLTLTIDYMLQEKAASLLEAFCCGAIVAIDPRNGEILSMTSYPRYDANIFSSVIPTDVWKGIMNDSTHPLLNRPLSGLYPPGSTVKFVTVGAALDLDLITPSTHLVSCRGGYQFGNRFFGCWLKGGHGSIDAIQSLEQSCDTYLYQLGIKLGVDNLAKYYSACGFGKATGVDLPNEQSGLIPTTTYYDKRYGKRGWTNALVLNTSIGQGEVLVTPLQLAQFFCGLAMRGTVYEPHIVKAMTTDGVAEQVKPVVAFQLPFKPETMNALYEGMRRVVEGPGGTARRLRNNLYSIGGKTGTAQNPHGNDHSWFVGVAPLENPEIVCCAIIENAGHGSDVAAPIVGQVIEAYMKHKLGLDTVTVAVVGGMY